MQRTHAKYEQTGLVSCGASACKPARTAPPSPAKTNRRNIIVYKEGLHPSVPPPCKYLLYKYGGCRVRNWYRYNHNITN